MYIILQHAIWNRAYVSPNTIIISSTRFWSPQNGIQNDGYLIKSTDGGQNYTKLPGYQEAWGRSLVAIASNNPLNIVVAHEDEIHYSIDGGATFNQANITGLGNIVINNVFRRHRNLVSDFVDNDTFYVYDWTSGKVYASTNQGQDWNFIGQFGK